MKELLINLLNEKLTDSNLLKIHLNKVRDIESRKRGRRGNREVSTGCRKSLDDFPDFFGKARPFLQIGSIDAMVRIIRSAGIRYEDTACRQIIDVIAASCSKCCENQTRGMLVISLVLPDEGIIS